MLAVGIVVVTVAYALTYVGVERFRGDKRSLTYMVLGRDAPRGWTAGTPVRVLAN